MTTETQPDLQKHQNTFIKQTDGWMKGKIKEKEGERTDVPGPSVMINNLSCGVRARYKYT